MDKYLSSLCSDKSMCVHVELGVAVVVVVGGFISCHWKFEKINNKFMIFFCLTRLKIMKIFELDVLNSKNMYEYIG